MVRCGGGRWRRLWRGHRSFLDVVRWKERGHRSFLGLGGTHPPALAHCPRPHPGIPPEYNIVCKDVNGIQVPRSAYPQGMPRVLVDFSSKTAT